MATAANITFVGSGEIEEGSDVPSFTWGGLDFALNTPVLVDPDAAETAEMRRHYEYMIIKAKTHPALTIEEVTPAGRKGRRVKGRDDEDDGEDEPVNGDYDLSTLPKGWRELHHKRLIAMAHKAGAGDEVNTRDGAIAFIEERLALDASKDEVPF
jgi:hypothetical protein